jgi:hypothetical protein
MQVRYEHVIGAPASCTLIGVIEPLLILSCCHRQLGGLYAEERGSIHAAPENSAGEIAVRDSRLVGIETRLAKPRTSVNADWCSVWYALRRYHWARHASPIGRMSLTKDADSK